MHGFHATPQQCSYGWVMFPISWTVAAGLCGIVLLLV